MKHLKRAMRGAIVSLATIAFAGGVLVAPVGAATAVNCAKFHVDGKASNPLWRVALPPAAACATMTNNGFPIPDPRCTPGAVNPTLTADVLRDPGFRTSCVRDSATTAVQKGTTYKFYNIPHPKNNTGPTQTCELDHLISLEIGGADTLENIWPQCGPDRVQLRQRYFKQKDIVENFLARQVKAGKMNLADVQRGISQDWTQFLGPAQQAQPTPAVRRNGSVKKKQTVKKSKTRRT
jgi:hypothetical protein